MVEEKLDIFDKNGRKTGVRKTKKEAHAFGLWHRASHVWIYNSKHEILMQKRSMQKDSHPGKWDISAAGHVSGGESPKAAAVREIYEEIGLMANPKLIKKAMVWKTESKDKPGYNNKEFDHVYTFKYDGPLKTLKRQKEEVSGLRFIKANKLRREVLSKKTAKKYVPHGRYYLEIIKIINKE